MSERSMSDRRTAPPINAPEATVMLDELESKALLKRVGIPVVETRLARDEQEAVDLSVQLGYPVALKIASRDVAHKSDIGAVRLGLTHEIAVREAYTAIITAVHQRLPAATIRGVSVQRMAPAGIELLVGVSRDANFGPVIMFGLGGTLVEVIGDTALRVLPIDRRDASGMLEELRGRPLLDGFRGQPGANLAELEDLLVRVSDLVVGEPEILELDLNPVIAYPHGNLVVDARAVVTSGRA
jgi:acyl-CoA synthetase (NDP forming)